MARGPRSSTATCGGEAAARRRAPSPPTPRPAPARAPDGGPYTASGYASLHTGTVGFGSSPAQVVTANGDPALSSAFDPIAGTSDACKTTSSAPEGGVATYSLQVPSSFTMLGLPTVKATIETLGDFGELDSMLLDVAPDGSERLVSRGAYRLTDDQTRTVTFQPHGNGYRFDAGHTAELVLLGSDDPYLRRSDDVGFTVQVSDVTVTLPTVG
jgi:predicted acyl esterase